MQERDTTWLLEEKYGGVESDAFHADCERLAAGEPLGYVIGHVPFLDCQIWLDSRPLIPRPETEFWVEHAIREIKQYQAKGSPSPQREGLPFAHASSLSILDLCAGSGAVGVAVAKAIPEATVTFAELDPAHLPTIKKNIALNNANTPNQLGVLASDLFADVPRVFDFIVTNPPYIDPAANTVDESVVAHEPHVALFGGTDGLELIARIIEGARAQLAPQTPTSTGGQLWIEHEPFQTDAIHSLAAQYNFLITTHDDQYHTPRYSIITMAQ